ncbi:hypothetical protein ABPG74_013048 [Tetrahymena malaccensis]
MNQTTKNSIFCDNHTSKQALVMKYDQSGVIQFECLKCLCNDQSQRSFIYLEDLIEQQNDQMIDNWPLLNNQSLFKQFQEIKNKQQQQSILQNFIHQMEQLEIQVIERFAEYKKTFINKFECMNGDQVIQKWNEISQVGQFKNFMDSLLKTYDEHIIIIKGIDLSTLQTNDYKEFIKSIKTCQQTNGWWISVEYSFNLKDIKISQDNNFSKFGEKNIMKTLYKKENETGDQKSKRKSQNLELRNRLTFIKWLHDFLNQNK